MNVKFKDGTVVEWEEGTKGWHLSEEVGQVYGTCFYHDGIWNAELRIQCTECGHEDVAIGLKPKENTLSEAKSACETILKALKGVAG
jgi:hypothetical protein